MDKQLDEAEATLKKAVASDPGGIVGNRALAEFYVATGRFDEAVAAVRAGLSRQQDESSLRLLLATTLERSGNLTTPSLNMSACLPPIRARQSPPTIWRACCPNIAAVINRASTGLTRSPAGSSRPTFRNTKTRLAGSIT